MPYRWQTFQINPEGGLIESVAALRQGQELPGSASRLINFEVSVDGGYRRINGFNKFSDTAVPGTGQIWGVVYYDGTVITSRNGNVYSGTGTTWTTIASGRTHTTKQRSQIINLDGTRKVLTVDGVNYPYTWDGTTFTNISGSTDVLGTSHAVQFKDHIFYAAGNLVTFTVPFLEGDFTVADGAGNFRVQDDVTGMIVFRERLFIFTETSISVLDGDSQVDWRLTSVTEDIGCVAPDTIQEVAGDVAFLSNDGIRLLGGTDRIGDFSNQVASRPVQQNFLEFQSSYPQFSSCVVRGKSQYRIFGFQEGRLTSASESYCATQFEAQNPLSFAWAEHLGIKVYAIDSRIYDGDEYIVFCNEMDYIYQLENGNNFDGTDIEAQYWTPYLSFDDPRIRKTIYKVTSYFDPEDQITGTINMNLNFDNDDTLQPSIQTLNSDSGGGTVYGAAVYGTSVYGGNTKDTILISPMQGSGDQAQIRYEFTGGLPFIFDAILIEYAMEDRS